MDKTKNEFISVTAHELKTPLASIHGFAKLLQDKRILGDIKQRDYYLNIIMEDSVRLKKLIDDILDLSRLDLGTMKFVFEKIDVKEIFKNVVKELYLLAAKKGLTLKAGVSNNVPDQITADRSRLTQVIVNLVNNAIKYSPKKGSRIIISASKQGDGYVLFSVQDRGTGIPRKYLKKIFERFYQVDSSYTRKVGGTGLGLSICKGIVEAMGGKIWVSSQVGRGSTFFFTLPIKSKLLSYKEESLQIFKSPEPEEEPKQEPKESKQKPKQTAKKSGKTTKNPKK
jgi:signal transduction histidine kinase